MSEGEDIFEIHPEVLDDTELLYELIYNNTEQHYYWTLNYSADFYIKLARAGFITVSFTFLDEFYFIPEIQYDYAILDFKDLHIERNVKKLLKNNHYIFEINYSIAEIIDGIEKQHEPSWMKNQYRDLMLELYSMDRHDFKLITAAILDKETEVAVAGEVGYITGKVYTSLSGFSIREKKYKNYGKLQLVLLAKYLEEIGMHFWNLGHTKMQYKIDLGAKIYTRKEFLERWISAVYL